MIAVSLAAVLLSSALIMGVMYYLSYTQVKKEVAVQAAYVAAAVEQEGISYVKRVGVREDIGRITWISADGAVRYDNRDDETKMENHAERPEIKQALAAGAGASVRLSDTQKTQNFYYALRLSDGSVIRVAIASSSAAASVLACLPWVMFIAAAVILGGIFFARYQTERIVAPINEIDTRDPDLSQVYDELAPLVTRIEKQNQEIKTRIDELGAAQREFSEITAHMSEGLVVLDANVHVLSVNDSARRVFAADESCIGAHLFGLTRNPRVAACVDEALAGTASVREMTRGDFTYELLASPVREAETGRVRGVILLILDITERRQTEKMRREFSANVSHELKTPLTAILGYAELIQSGMAKPEDVARFAENIRKEAGRLITLIEDIMHLSGLDERGKELVKQPLDLGEAAKRAADRLKERAARRRVCLDVSAAPAGILGVPAVVEELIYNLLDNAIKYNKDGGSVSVQVAQKDDQAVLLVADTGIGIAPEDLERIYERFYRVDKSHTKQTGGTGLGLSIVKHAAALHKAVIHTESTPGEGTVIEVCFPLANQAKEE